MIPEPLEIATIHAAYRAGKLTPAGLAGELLRRIEAYPDPAVFISRVTPAEVLAAATALNPAELEEKPLWGIPFVVKDNIDVGGMETTAACPDFAYVAADDATSVARLRQAGAILLGKTNLDQFATGLNGTRSPYGAPRSVFNADYISGGSSSGSAVAVAAGLAVFSLGTDTAGSGRVPAAFNNLIGLKPTIGRISKAGLVPACKSLDCISVFANSAADSLAVLKAAEGFDPADPYSRAPFETILPITPRAGIPRPDELDFAGDTESAALYDAALKSAAALGWELVEIDYAPLRDIAAALYGGPLAAERIAGIRDFYETSASAIHPVVRGIMEGATKFSAVDLFAEQYRIQALRGAANAVIGAVDILLLPTAPTIFTVEAMLGDPLGLNAKLGLYTNFVNLCDLAGIALPAGFSASGLPFGVTLIGPAFSEFALAAYADVLHAALGAGAGAARALPQTRVSPRRQEMTLVVAGAHLSGMALNHELLALGATLLTATITAPGYRLYALKTNPPKPGLVRTPGFNGTGIAVEVWSLSAQNFGRFIAALPEPMGIGKVTLADGTIHPGFLCEAHAISGAEDITDYGGWRAYRSVAVS
jgi:allophanate hydrolase